MKKRIIATLLAATLMTTTLMGCTTGGGSSSTPGNDISKDSSNDGTKKEPQTITMAHGQGEWAWPMMDEVVNKYKELSGNTVELLYVPSDGTQTWITTQFAGNTAPDLIFASSSPAGDFYKNDWIVDLKPYYEGKSNYTGEIWQDSFSDGVLKGVIDTNGTGAMVGMPTGVVTTNLYYNKDIFDRLGIKADDTLSWSGVLEAAKTIKDKEPDTIPMSVQNSISWNLGWQENFMMEQLWYDLIPKVDVIDANGRLETSEWALAVKAGVAQLDDNRMVDYFKFMKELSKYFNIGFNSASWEFEALFNEAKSAMAINGSWFPSQCIQNGIDVNYGIGPMPYVDSAISDKAENRVRKYAIGLGGPDMMVTKKAVDDGRVETVIDFLQYFSDPKTGAKLVAEKLMWIPVVKDVEVPEVMKGITNYVGDDEQAVNWNAALIAMTPEARDKYQVMFANFLDSDKITAEQMTQDFKTLYLEATDTAIADHPEWKVDENLSKVKE